MNQGLDAFLSDSEIWSILKVNEYNHIRWFNKEAAERLLDILIIMGFYKDIFQPNRSIAGRIESMNVVSKAVDLLRKRIDQSEYHVDALFSGEPEDELIDNEPDQQKMGDAKPE